ncbi:sigma-70 family RNA polymerase sigma factor [Sphingobium sp. CR2-8]|uniref:RNA polymerase sigma factor n=1 Tax=Sphingobium sp. CR2-8 TaxID=1306534 RepID=UPI002DBA1820|nr:sigma-70 family RNA polymerase sigma factor [Sphingobium sp. CR2-8]MEC3909380.1 sigma-70 family RNA polymerase sigma factor [Sphingobium sp. CR2-8]
MSLTSAILQLAEMPLHRASSGRLNDVKKGTCMEAVRVRLDWFKVAILPHEGALRARLRRIVNRPCDVDDLVAESMTRAYANGDVTRTTSGKAYLFQIARNLLIDEARREKIVSLELVAELDVLNVDHSTEATLQARDELRHLQAILDSLPPQCRHAFIERRVHGKSVKEIAEEMGLSVFTVDKHLTRAAVKIMQAIGQFEGSGFGWSLQKRGRNTGDRSRSGASLP